MIEALIAQFAGQAGNAIFGGGKGGGSAPPAQPSRSEAESAIYGSGLDSSGWSVNFSGNQSAGGAGGGSLLPGGLPAIPLWVWVAVAGVAVWRFRSKK